MYVQLRKVTEILLWSRLVDKIHQYIQFCQKSSSRLTTPQQLWTLKTACYTLRVWEYQIEYSEVSSMSVDAMAYCIAIQVISRHDSDPGTTL